MSLTHSSVPGSSGPKKNYKKSIQITTKMCRLSSEDQPHLRLGATDLVISRTISQTFLRTHKKCLSTANKTARLQPLYTTSSPLIQSKLQLLDWNMTSLKQLINKLDQVFLLMLVNVLILWMNLKLEKK